MRLFPVRPIAILSVPLLFVCALSSGCKARTFNAHVKNDTASKTDGTPSALSPAATAKALSREACVGFLREKTRTPAGVAKYLATNTSFDAQKDTAQFLYCRDLLTALLVGHDELQCVAARTNFFLYGAQHRYSTSTNSQGFHLSDADYAILNQERISLGANLPSFLDFTQADEQKRHQALVLLSRLFRSTKTEAAYGEAMRLVSENNADASKPRLWLTRYQVERTISPKSWRIIFIKEDKNTKCTYLTSLVPPHPGGDDGRIATNDISTHTICDSLSIDRVDKKTSNAVWMFNWKQDPSANTLSYGIQKAPDGHCYRCHQSKSKLIYPDVAKDYVFDESSKLAMDYIRSGTNRFRAKADWITGINVDGKVRHVSNVTPDEMQLPTSFAAQDAHGVVLREQPKSPLFQQCIQHHGISLEKAEKARVSCRQCHSDDPKSIAGTWIMGRGYAVDGQAAVWPLVLQPTHPFHKFHKDFSEGLFDCLKVESDSPERKQEWKIRIEGACAKLAANPDFEWISNIPTGIAYPMMGRIE